MTDEREEALRLWKRVGGPDVADISEEGHEEDARQVIEDFYRLARAQPQGEPDKLRPDLLDKTLRQHAHELRREACSAWSAVIGKGDIDQAKCEYAQAIENRLRCVIDELADTSSPAQPDAVPDGLMLAVEALARLVHLKDYKDTRGKDVYYEREQPDAWQQARSALSVAPKPGGK